MLRNALLGGSMLTPLYAPDTGAGAGGGDGGSAGQGGAAAAAAAGAGGAGTGGAAAGSGGAGDSGAAGSGAAAGGTGATLAGGADGGTAAVAAAAAAAVGKPAFPDNWRELLAGEDKDAAKDLTKYTDPTGVYKSLRELQTKISKGELKAPPQPLPANATEEQKAEWRKANNLPATAEDYVKGLALPQGVVLGEADKPLVADFAKTMLEGGASQAEMDRAVSWWYAQQDRVQAERAEVDSQTRVASEVELRGEWKGDFSANMNAVASIGAVLGQDGWATLVTARSADGQMLGNTVAFNKAMAQLGRELNPAATLVPAGDGNAAKTIDAEIESIEKSMYDERGTPSREYWGSETKQARYRELIDAKEKMTARGSRAA